MSNVLRVGGVAFLLLFSLLTAAAEEKSPPPAAAQPAAPRYASVRALGENVTLATLENGLTVIVQENHVAAVATVRCYVKNTGSAFEGRYLGAGLSHVLEHVVCGGSTQRRSEKEIQRIIESFGGATNAYTTNETTSFHIDCPVKNVLTAVDLVADAMQHVRFEPAEFNRELKVVRRELADDEADRGHVLDDLLDATVYTTSPMRCPVIGYLQVLNGTTNQAIIDFYHERYVPNNQVFVVVGDVKTREILEAVARQWAGTPRGRETDVPLAAEPEQLAPRQAAREMEGKTYDTVLAWPTVKLSDPDMYALDLAAYILGEGESSRLVRRLKYDRPLVQSIAAVSETPHFVRGYFAVEASCLPERWRPATEAILGEVYRLREELVDEAELAKAKKQKAVEWLFDRQTVQQAAESLGRGFLAAHDPLFDQAYAQHPEGDGGRSARGRPPLVRPRAAQPRDHRAAGGRAEGRRRGRGRRQRKGHAGAIVQRVARARQAARQPAAGEYPGLRAGRRWWTTRRPPAAPPWWPTCSTRGPPTIRPRPSPAISTPSAAGFPSAPAASPSLAKPPRCGKTFRRRPRCSPSASCARRFPPGSSPRSRGSPWGPSPTARPIRRPRSPRSLPTTSPPPRPITWSRKGRRSRCGP